VLWTRETEAGRFDTPERRAGLEARLGQITAAIPDSVRKYYRQDLEQRLRNLFAPAVDAYAGRREPRGRFPQRGSRGRQRPANNSPVASPRLSASSIVRGYRTALPPREALILLAVVNHPWLLESRAEELSELEFLHSDADRLRRALLDAGASHAIAAPETLRQALAALNIENILLRVEAAVTHAADWPVRPDAAAEDVQHWWAQVVTLHRKSRTLNRELKEAERALGDEPTEENLAWLRDVQNRLLAFEGTEAIIEGFGALSGRPSRA
jgi:DNA primase